MSINNLSDTNIFVKLFKATYQKCFGFELEKVPTETECKYLCDEIEDKTGLVIGWKSLKNYSIFILDEKSEKVVNPSTSTLDTLSRYVLETPLATEKERKNQRNPYLYWFQYKERFLERHLKSESFKISWRKIGFALLVVVFTLTLLILFKFSKDLEITETFQVLDEASLSKREWFTLNKNNKYWALRDSIPNQLTLFTLNGDNWKSKYHEPEINNLLYRELPEGDFGVEIHFSDFVPSENWQQAGLLIMEDTLYSGKSLRVSLGYNDFSGGIEQPGEILVQVVASKGKEFENVEEVEHYSLFKMDNSNNSRFIENNLKHSALKIEKRGENYRFLYAASPLDNFSLKEIRQYNFKMKPKYIGIFAIKGFVENTEIIPVPIKFFRLENL